MDGKPGSPNSNDDDAVTDAELQALSSRARSEGDEPLRRLVRSYLMLRRVTADVITLVSAREGGSSIANTPLLRRARELSAIEGER